MLDGARQCHSWPGTNSSPVPSGWPSQHKGSWLFRLKRREARVRKARREWWDVCQAQAETWCLIKEGTGKH